MHRVPLLRSGGKTNRKAATPSAGLPKSLGSQGPYMEDIELDRSTNRLNPDRIDPPGLLSHPNRFRRQRDASDQEAASAGDQAQNLGTRIPRRLRSRSGRS